MHPLDAFIVICYAAWGWSKLTNMFYFKGTSILMLSALSLGMFISPTFIENITLPIRAVATVLFVFTIVGQIPRIRNWREIFTGIRYGEYKDDPSL